MTSYRFVPQYSSTTSPLRLLLKKDAQWAWTPACEAAVMQLKAQLIAPPVLAHFHPSSPALLTCDASNYAVGAVLSQLHNGTERPISFASRALDSIWSKSKWTFAVSSVASHITNVISSWPMTCTRSGQRQSLPGRSPQMRSLTF